MKSRGHHKSMHRFVLSVIACSVMSAYAADAPTDIGSVSAEGGTGGGTAATTKRKAVTPAAGAALTQAPLEARSPQTLISGDYIDNQVLPYADYGALIRLAPSYTSSSPNGVGMSEAKGQTLRGFPDGQFNVTYDGVPFGDTNDFSHHTTSYFPAATIGSVNIDRSPGSASTIGYATFGGSINLYSPTLDAQSNLRPYLTVGSHDTQLYGIGYNSGITPGLLDNNLFINVESLRSDGALTNGGLRNKNAFIKDQLPLDENTTLTALYTVDKIHFNNPSGATLNQVAQYGYNYGLNNDPTSPNYWGYDYQDKHTDFGYLDLKHDFNNGWNVSNKLYTYYYYNMSHELNGDVTSSPLSAVKAATPFAPGQAGTDIAGALKLNEYRTTGDVFQIENTSHYGTLRTGLWVEHTFNKRNRYAVDFTTNTPYKQNATYGNTYYDMVDYVDNRQVFGEFEWKATDTLTVTPGLRYQNFQRTLNANINQNNLAGTGGNVSKTWNSFLPSLDVHYQFTPLWTGYAQVGKGVLAPNLNTLYSGNALANNSVEPQTSTAYQLGTVYKADSFTLNADVYLVDFTNYIAKSGGGANATYFNAGGVRYSGIEAEGNVLVGYGFSIYANGSLNKAVFKEDGLASAGQGWKSGQTISGVPQYTAALGLNYAMSQWKAGLITKFVGSMYQGKNGEADGDIYRVGSYSVSDFSLSREFSNLLPHTKNVRISFTINNLFNTHAITDNNGPAANDTSGGKDPNQFLYYFVPERSYFLSLRADI
ncbi:TonB-dependent receptor [Andreprevotia chitinilytica]|uniref:TonB-dependent receptor n=1 Tax=Andreprevotia chitinilytica TaxID=396808 RepID=UPI000A03EED0|nr:TonB-dependent receptor [Andreprevotia chitinilytica]